MEENAPAPLTHEPRPLPSDYQAYVSDLYQNFPHLKPLYDFLSLEEPDSCIGDTITVLDVSETGQIDKKLLRTVSCADNGQTLLRSLEGVSSHLKTRIVSVSQLTPTSAKILGSCYNLGADFLNGHLPNGNKLTHIPSESTFHIDFLESYHLDNPFQTIFHGEKITEASDTHHFLFFCMVHQSLDSLFIKPDFELLNLKDNSASFLVKQRISVHVTHKGNTRIVILLHYPKLQPVTFIDDGEHDVDWRELRKTNGIHFRRRLDAVPSPSQVSGKNFNGSALTSFDLHLSSLLENCILNNAMGLHHTHLNILCEVFRMVSYSLVAAMERLQQNLQDLGSYKNLRNPEGDNFDLEKNTEVIRDYREHFSSAISVWKSLGRVGNSEIGRKNDNNSPLAEFESFVGNWRRLGQQLEHIRSQLESLHETAEKVSRTRLNLVQLLESRKAISQADSVRRLTNLAFFFVPLTYVASVFGANIRGMDDHRTIKAFAISSISTTCIAILAALLLEQYIFPIIARPFIKWKDSVWEVFRQLNRGNADYHATRLSGWYLLPTRTLHLGWLWLKFLWVSCVWRRLRRSNIDTV